MMMVMVMMYVIKRRQLPNIIYLSNKLLVYHKFGSYVILFDFNKAIVTMTYKLEFKAPNN